MTTTAIDTNVLIGLFSGTVAESGAASQALAQASSEGPLVICPAVYAELMAMPGLTEDELDAFLAETGIDVDWAMGTVAWKSAGRAYRSYAIRRRKQKGDEGPRRILADFLIGTHAVNGASRLLTADP